MKILVTGAAGFIGYHMIQKLVKTNHEIIGIDNINDYYSIDLKNSRLKKCGIQTEDISYGIKLPSSVYDNYSFIKLNLEDNNNILALFAETKFDYVIALAAQAGVRYSLQNPYSYVNSNITGFMNLLEACRYNPVKHLIYASTSSVYGLNSKMPFTETDGTDHPVSLYAATKKANEMMAHSYSHLFHIPSTGLRFFTVYGPWGRPDMALFKFTEAIINNKAIDVYNNGEMLRDFTYVSDIVENIYRLLAHPPVSNPDWDSYTANPATSSAPYRILNIGNSSPLKLTSYIEAIEKALNKKAVKNLMPLQPGDVLATHANIDALEQITQFSPKTSVIEGVKNFVDWYVDYYKVLVEEA